MTAPTNPLTDAELERHVLIAEGLCARHQRLAPIRRRAHAEAEAHMMEQEEIAIRALLAQARRAGELEASALAMKDMREDAQRLGYPSVLEALEAVSELQAEVEALRGAVEKAEAFVSAIARMDPVFAKGFEKTRIANARDLLSQLRAAREGRSALLGEEGEVG